MGKIRIDRDRIDRYFKGEGGEEDRAYLMDLFSDKIPEKDLEKYLRRHWMELTSESNIRESGLDKVLYKIHYEINTKSSSPVGTSKLFLKWFSRVAAILVLPLLIYFFIDFYRSHSRENLSYIEIMAPAWASGQLDLPDGTRVWLNSNSSLKYHRDFANNREVMLDGEAFFDVTKALKKPFVVQTDQITVSALGTKFNVSSYENEKIIEVVLENGELLINSKIARASYTMKPNDCITYDKCINDFKRTVVQPDKYSSWINGKLVFRNDPMDVIARKLARFYNVDIELVGNTYGQPLLWATFDNENIEEVLDLLKLSLNFTYEIRPPQFSKDESYSKKKVIIKSNSR